MQNVSTPSGINLSFERSGSGPPLVLVHGSFSDHRSNWERVMPNLEERFTVHAVARRGRGDTTATEGHGVEDEAADIAALIGSIGEPVFLLGHSYGAQIALAAAARMPDRVRRLVLYEPPWPDTVSGGELERLETLARSGDWDGFATTFLRDTLDVPTEELEGLRASDAWPPIAADARASLGDLRALRRYAFAADDFRDLRLPVLLQVGTESPQEAFATEALADTLPDARVDELDGQAHEGMQTAPDLYAQSVVRFLAA